MEETKEEKQRSIQQNKALHKLFELLAVALNEAGLDMRKTLKPGVDIPWEKITVKEFLWKPIQKLQLGKDHSAELNTKEVDMVFATLMKHLGEQFGLYVPFPITAKILFFNFSSNSGSLSSSQVKKL